MSDQQRKLRISSQHFRLIRYLAVVLSTFLCIFSGSLYDLDSDIPSLQVRMLSLPRCNPQRAVCVQRLARARFKRHTFSSIPDDDLEQSILGFAEAIFLQIPRDISPQTLFKYSATSVSQFIFAPGCPGNPMISSPASCTFAICTRNGMRSPLTTIVLSWRLSPVRWRSRWS
jgi:hypothetical protein